MIGKYFDTVQLEPKKLNESVSRSRKFGAIMLCGYYIFVVQNAVKQENRKKSEMFTISFGFVVRRKRENANI